MPSASIKTELSGLDEADALLGKLALAMRGPALKSAMRKSLKPVVARAKQLCPKGGPRVGKKAGKKHLADTITSAVRDYGEVIVGVAGAAYPAGAHAHNVEFGHDIVRGPRGGTQVVVGRAAPHPFMRPAVEQTVDEQKRIFGAELQQIAAEATG